MIKYLSLCLILFVGCAVDTESTDDYSDPVTYENPENPDWDNPDSSSNQGCRGEVIDMLDGTQMYVSGYCDPFYIYSGYPDPTEQPEEFEFERFINPQEGN